LNPTPRMQFLKRCVDEKKGHFDGLDILACDGRSLGGLLRRGLVVMYWSNGKPYLRSSNTSLLGTLDPYER
jgi:hypothetical protein